MQPPEVTEQKGYLLIRDLWKQGTASVHDMPVVKTDALTHRKKDPEKCFHKAERGEYNVSGGLPPAASALLPPCRLGGRAAGGGGDGYPEKDSQLPGHQVETVLLKDVWIHQE